MRVILDSNKLFSALISPNKPPHRIYQAWQQGAFELVTCLEQTSEIRKASRYPKFKAILQPHRVVIGQTQIVTASVFCDKVLK